MADPLDDCGHCTLSPTVSGKDARAVQATCPVHGTPPYAPLSAPSASVADRDTHPAVRAGAEALGSTVDEDDIRRADDDPEEWCAECLRRDAAAINAARLVAPAVLRWAADRLNDQPLHCAAHQSVRCEVCPRGADLLRADADEITRSTR